MSVSDSVIQGSFDAEVVPVQSRASPRSGPRGAFCCHCPTKRRTQHNFHFRLPSCKCFRNTTIKIRGLFKLRSACLDSRYQPVFLLEPVYPFRHLHTTPQTLSLQPHKMEDLFESFKPSQVGQDLVYASLSSYLSSLLDCILSPAFCFSLPMGTVVPQA